MSSAIIGSREAFYAPCWSHMLLYALLVVVGDVLRPYGDKKESYALAIAPPPCLRPQVGVGGVLRPWRHPYALMESFTHLDE